MLAAPLTALLLLGQVARATPQQDLDLASRPDLPERNRMEAFDRLVAGGSTDISLIAQVASNENADTRERWVAIRVLGKVGGDRPRSLLVALLEDPQPAIRAAATQALGDVADARVSGAVALRLQDPAIIVRAAAAEALGKIGDADTVAALAQALLSRDNWYRGSSLWVRRHYVDSLGQIGSRKAIPTLLRCLDDADPQVVAGALGAFEAVAGFSYAEGRDSERQREAWRRWGQAQL